MNRNNLLVSIMILTTFMASCTAIGPARFWVSFHKESIEKHKSDQGPWGGYREIQWKSKGQKIFETKEILNYANKKGWKLTDSLLLASVSLHSDRNKNEEYMYDLIRQTILNKWKLNDVNMIYIFETGWISVEPGNSRETDKNGFVGVSNDGKALFVYHRWGE